MGGSLAKINDSGRLHITVTNKPISQAAREKLPAVTYVLKEEELDQATLLRIFKELIRTLESHVSN